MEQISEESCSDLEENISEVWDEDSNEQINWTKPKSYLDIKTESSILKINFQMKVL